MEWNGMEWNGMNNGMKVGMSKFNLCLIFIIY